MKRRNNRICTAILLANSNDNRFKRWNISVITVHVNVFHRRPMRILFKSLHVLSWINRSRHQQMNRRRHVPTMTKDNHRVPYPWIIYSNETNKKRIRWTIWSRNKNDRECPKLCKNDALSFCFDVCPARRHHSSHLDSSTMPRRSDPICPWSMLVKSHLRLREEESTKSHSISEVSHHSFDGSANILSSLDFSISLVGFPDERSIPLHWSSWDRWFETTGSDLGQHPIIGRLDSVYRPRRVIAASRTEKLRSEEIRIRREKLSGHDNVQTLPANVEARRRTRRSFSFLSELSLWNAFQCQCSNSPADGVDRHREQQPHDGFSDGQWENVYL